MEKFVFMGGGFDALNIETASAVVEGSAAQSSLLTRFIGKGEQKCCKSHPRAG